MMRKVREVDAWLDLADHVAIPDELSHLAARRDELAAERAQLTTPEQQAAGADLVDGATTAEAVRRQQAAAAEAEALAEARQTLREAIKVAEVRIGHYIERHRDQLIAEVAGPAVRQIVD